MSRGVIIDQGHILLCRTLDLPISFYFLPGSHVEHGESVETSILRELMEETSAHFKIKRFLGCLEYSFEPGHSSICHNHEYNFIFEAESESLQRNNKISQLEAHIELIWRPCINYLKLTFRAEPLRALVP
ncbi:NUDIX domain-containing protein [Candidatus Orientia mediorientalis]|uniref:NUDIX domain-containing protein n=1 Tax=Candidatus Orientia mediorientalis TaxID=911112 RepID=UPI001E3BC2F1|nr:NUDIX domain-containing protein [Candidatus Orientia mediorientalis]